MDAVDSWRRALDDIVQDYNLDDIYNCDETGLLFRTMPTKSYVEKSDNAHGTKGSKERLTVLLCCNKSGTDKCKPLVIGKSLRPIDSKSLPVDYQANKKAWMNSILFTKWVKDFDRKMRLQKRQVLVFLDNATSHPDVRLTNTKLKFFPPNCTSKLQPLDQGIICNLKVHYRNKLLQRVLANIDEVATAAELVKAVNVLDAIHWIKQAWGLVTSDTITKCFIKSGFPAFGGFLADDLLDVQEVDTEMQDLVCQANDYATMKEDIMQLHQLDSENWEQELINTQPTNSTQATPDEQDSDEEPEHNNPPSSTEAIQSLHTLMAFIKNQSNQEQLLEKCMAIETDLNQLVLELRQQKKQTVINDFFGSV